MKEQWITSKLGVGVCAVLAAVLWGSAYPGIKLAYQCLNIGSAEIWSQVLFAGCRFTVAGLMTLALSFSLQKRVTIPSKAEFGDFLLLGFVMTYLCYLFFHIGLANTTGVKSAIWGSMSTFSTVLFSHFFTKNDRLSMRKTAGCILGFLGIVLLNLGGDFSGFSALGEGCLLLNAICFGAGSILSKKVSFKKDAVYVSGYQLLFGGVGLLLTGILGGGHFNTISLRGVLLIAYLAFVSAGGFGLWTTLLKWNPSSRVAIFHFLTPLFGAVFSSLVLGEKLFSAQNLSALVLVCMGVAIANREKGEQGNLTKQRLRDTFDKCCLCTSFRRQNHGANEREKNN